MMKTPCETIIWRVVPMIKKEFAQMLVHDFHLTQKETSIKLGTTEAAISRYISGKRGTLEITDEEILSEIKKSVEKISNSNESTAIKETCRICRILKSKNIIEGIRYDHK